MPRTNDAGLGRGVVWCRGCSKRLRRSALSFRPFLFRSYVAELETVDRTKRKIHVILLTMTGGSSTITKMLLALLVTYDRPMT